MEQVLGLKPQWSQEDSSAFECRFKWIFFFLAESRKDVYCGEWIEAEKQDASVLCACGAGSRPAGVCSPFTCGALTPRDTAVYTLNAKVLDTEWQMLLAMGHSGAFDGSESRIRIWRCLLSYWRHLYIRKYIYCNNSLKCYNLCTCHTENAN